MPACICKRHYPEIIQHMDHFHQPVPAFLDSLSSEVKLQGKGGNQRNHTLACNWLQAHGDNNQHCWVAPSCTITTWFALHCTQMTKFAGMSGLSFEGKVAYIIKWFAGLIWAASWELFALFWTKLTKLTLMTVRNL